MERPSRSPTFLDRRPNWKQWLESDNPVYVLPAEIIDLLKQPDNGTARRRAFLTPDDAAAEHDWRRVCAAMGRNVIGYWRGTPISSFAFSDDSCPNRPPGEHAAVERLKSRQQPDWIRTYGVWESAGDADAKPELEEFKHAVAGCVGELLFGSSASPAFRCDVNGLIERWKRLPAPLQVPIRDLRAKPVQRELASLLTDYPQVVSTAVDFSMELERVTSRWALCGFATWDIPVMAPPLLGIPMWQAALVLPPEAIVNFWPPHLFKPASIDLNKIVVNQQQDHSESQRCLDDDEVEMAALLGSQMRSTYKFPGFPLIRRGRKEQSLKNSEKIARMALAEICLRQRYRNRKYLATRLSEAFQTAFALQSKSVKNLRGRYLRHIRPPKAGRRKHVK